MPPNLDIYVRIPSRSRRVLREFLSGRVSEGLTAEAWSVEGSTAELIDHPLEGSGSATTLYSRRSHTLGDVSHAIVGFGSDGSLVLGVSLDNEGEDPTISEAAIELLDGLLEEFDGTEGAVVWEQPPPLSPAEWAALDTLGGLTVAHRRRPF